MPIAYVPSATDASVVIMSLNCVATLVDATRMLTPVGVSPTSTDSGGRPPRIVTTETADPPAANRIAAGSAEMVNEDVEDGAVAASPELSLHAAHSARASEATRIT